MSITAQRWLKLAGILTLYAVVLFAATALLVFDVAGGRTLPLAAKIAIALAPMVPALLTLPWLVENFRLMDEMQVRHQLNAIVAAAGASALLAMGYSFLEIIGFPRLPMAVVWCVMLGLWTIATLVQRLRFR